MTKVPFFSLCFFVFFAFNLNAQTFSSQDPEYIDNVKAGEKALNAENYSECLSFYSKAFKVKQTSYLSILRAAACAYSSDNQEALNTYLSKAFELSWDGSRNIFQSYPEFEYLKGTAFQELIEKQYMAAAKASGINIELMEELAVIREEDQAPRRAMMEISKKYGWESPQMDSIRTITIAADEKNTKRVIEILETYGYPGKSLVGNAQAGTAFLVIQHADLEIQEKYMKLITDAADAEEVQWRSVALLVDRVRMRNGQKQIYGSQVSRDPETGVHFFAPIDNPYQVDSVRATVGLGPIAEYGKRWDIKWDPKVHEARSKDR